MSNLLPFEEKKKNLREYIIRLLTAALIVIATVSIVASTMLFPAYIFSNTKERVLKEEIAATNEKSGGNLNATMKTVIADINNRLKIFPDKQQEMPISNMVIAPILKEKTSAVKIQEISYADERGGKTIIVSGFSATRSDLTQYVERLKKVPGFSKVTLPISSFVKDRNLDFTISITAEF